MARQKHHGAIAVCASTLLMLLSIDCCTNAFVWAPQRSTASAIAVRIGLPQRPNTNQCLTPGTFARSMANAPRFAFLFRGDDDGEEKGIESPKVVLPSVSPLAVVRRSLPLYIGWLGLGIFPALDYQFVGPTEPSWVLQAARTGYFFLFAITTIYLGAQRQDIGVTQAPVTEKGATTLPLVAATSLAILYAVIKYTSLDVGALYRVLTCIFGWICLTEVLQPLVAMSGVVSGEKEEEAYVEEPPENTPQWVPPTAQVETIGESKFDAARYKNSSLPASALALLPIFSYLFLVPSLVSSDVVDVEIGQLRLVATANNSIAGAIALASLGQVAIDSFVTGAALLVGLFLYDVVSVFGSDAMVTVATKIEAPIKVLFAGATVESGKYPFSVLGLGDVLAPGLFVAMLRQFDIESWYTSAKHQDKLPQTQEESLLSLDLFATAETPYFKNALIAYAIGLGGTFGALALTGKGQPALFYIVPALLVASLGTAAYRTETKELFAFQGSRAVAAQETRTAWKKARAEQRKDKP